MYSNNKLVLHLLSLIKQNGIKHIVICPGSRHYPIIRSLESDGCFELYSIVDERSAAFFALGLIQKYQEPVAICCTSGTSAINFGSAVVEAYYQKLPLLLITADRLPELLNQKEEQMFKQDTVYEGFIKYRGQLNEVKSATDEWYNNRIINEAFIALNSFDNGPVHLNVPIENHHLDSFETLELPVVRRITQISGDTLDDHITELISALKNKKVIILWGQNSSNNMQLLKYLNLFCHSFNCVILSDRLGNCRHSMCIENALPLFYAMTYKEKLDLKPDIVISLFGNYVFNSEIKNYLKNFGNEFQHWDIGNSNVCDPFKKLTKIFSMGEEYFFRKISENLTEINNTQYFDSWNSIKLRIKEPNLDYGEFYAVGELIHKLPKNSSLVIANSLPIRMSHFFELDNSIKVFCNRGVNGIDGCMSSAVGYASSGEELVYLIIGDLTFFYDMNALWNRYLSKKLRIILLNNEGGGVMHLPLNKVSSDDISKHVSAGHATSAKGWTESLKITYLSATNKEECDQNIQRLIDVDAQGPLLLEIFSKKENDVLSFKNHISSLFSDDPMSVKIKRKLKDKFGKVLPSFLIE